VEGYVEKKMGASLVYGIAVHKFIEVMYRTKGRFPDAMAEAKKVFLELPVHVNPKKMWQRDITHLTSTCHSLWITQVMEDKNFEVLEINGVSATEITFDFPYFEDEFVKVNLCGTIDSVGKFNGGVFAIRDWKTTSSWDTKNYFTQYELSRQLRIYTLACKLMARLEPESVLGRVGASRMGAFIDCIALKPDTNGATFLRSPVYTYTDEDLSAFQLTLDDQCKRLSSAVKTGYLPKEGIVNGTCDGKWGQCQFWNVCKSNSDIAALLLGRDFNIKDFNPLRYNQ
jgi:hypothetical protein